MKQCIENPNEVKWDEFWASELEAKKDRGKDWDKAAAGFKKRAKKDDYHELLFSKLILDENDSVLDLGCGEGSITLPLARKVRKVTGVDSSVKMLELLNERADDEGIDNVETILKPLEDITYDEVGPHDVVLASRSLNGIIPIKETLAEINRIARKYVFITLFGPENWKIEGEFNEYIGRENKHFPGHNYLFNILFNMGIYANVERLDIKAFREYDTIEEAMDNGKFRLDLLSDDEKDKLRQYLSEILSENPETGKLYNKKDKADWILIWWRKD
ncbi:class I SAM-dependent methyltransferase [Methanobrevibacter millerae]|uniref:Methyltransferase domain-containing protein n=1 Tax=Methanobrevibacter millerae TaxID=230361 RepID=A0A1G5XA41_9EURY|nr:class I SAM-dependent methyltransferase [Methanobrevibacter millerae]SDA66894.1 Methyltransferase domain-containing protein [Methanobrevibacter millerae]